MNTTQNNNNYKAIDFSAIAEAQEDSQLADAVRQNLKQRIARSVISSTRAVHFTAPLDEQPLHNWDGTAFFPDLVFYHIPQKRYVVIELKAVEFMPEFAGKLNFYVTAADELLRGEGDNPSVGIIICKTAKKTVVEWSLKDIQEPLGVATYQIEQIVERTVLELKQREKKK